MRFPSASQQITGFPGQFVRDESQQSADWYLDMCSLGVCTSRASWHAGLSPCQGWGAPPDVQRLSMRQPQHAHIVGHGYWIIHLTTFGMTPTTACEQVMHMEGWRAAMRGVSAISFLVAALVATFASDPQMDPTTTSKRETPPNLGTTLTDTFEHESAGGLLSRFTQRSHNTPTPTAGGTPLVGGLVAGGGLLREVALSIRCGWEAIKEIMVIRSFQIIVAQVSRTVVTCATGLRPCSYPPLSVSLLYMCHEYMCTPIVAHDRRSLQRETLRPPCHSAAMQQCHPSHTTHCPKTPPASPAVRLHAYAGSSPERSPICQDCSFGTKAATQAVENTEACTPRHVCRALSARCHGTRSRS
jgi:hypothetical protein